MRFFAVVFLLMFLSSAAEARSAVDCQRAWSQAVRSYLTKNRRAGPDGKTPSNLDEEEWASQAWMSAFSGACEKESQGMREDARIEAALTGVKILAKLDSRACNRFLTYYMESSRANDICSQVRLPKFSDQDVKKKIASSIPSPKKR